MERTARDAVAALERIDDIVLEEIEDNVHGMLSRFRSKPRKVSLFSHFFNRYRLSPLPLQNTEDLTISHGTIDNDTPLGGRYAGPQWLACRHLELLFVNVPSTIFVDVFPNLVHWRCSVAQVSWPSTSAVLSSQNSWPFVIWLWTSQGSPSCDPKWVLNPHALLWRELVELSPRLKYFILKLDAKANILRWLTTVRVFVPREEKKQSQILLRDTLAESMSSLHYIAVSCLAWVMEMPREVGDAIWRAAA
ncbi:hypothetical protein SCP_0214220 [Sparassis crispa]|uniref:Uncharacterized protein n=1 Tax=Sparassis crispa TaxID=139825 RepID=A0A401GDG4_9APHY|nr:hypothetical protein SCP_0214220 [Sparassis crispa]GBE80212.1 hypothetical protein SCP_0214220 [Sparassis crispa]